MNTNDIGRYSDERREREMEAAREQRGRLKDRIDELRARRDTMEEEIGNIEWQISELYSRCEALDRTMDNLEKAGVERDDTQPDILPGQRPLVEGMDPRAYRRRNVNVL